MRVYTTPELKVTYFETEVVLTSDGTEIPVLLQQSDLLQEAKVGEKTVQKVAGIDFANLAE